jgi:hypothetical protein
MRITQMYTKQTNGLVSHLVKDIMCPRMDTLVRQSLEIPTLTLNRRNRNTKQLESVEKLRVRMNVKQLIPEIEETVVHLLVNMAQSLRCRRIERVTGTHLWEGIEASLGLQTSGFMAMFASVFKQVCREYPEMQNDTQLRSRVLIATPPEARKVVVLRRLFQALLDALGEESSLVLTPAAVFLVYQALCKFVTEWAARTVAMISTEERNTLNKIDRAMFKPCYVDITWGMMQNCVFRTSEDYMTADRFAREAFAAHEARPRRSRAHPDGESSDHRQATERSSTTNNKRGQVDEETPEEFTSS